MPRPRRRTLSHNEIENFLSEISAVENQDGPIKPAHMKYNENNQVESSEEVEVKPEVAAKPIDEADYIREFCKVSYEIQLKYHL